MKINRDAFGFLKIEIDSRAIVGILEQTLYYEKVDFNGDLEELQISLGNIKQIKFKEKRVNVDKTKGNFIGDLMLTLWSSTANPTTVEYDNPEIVIEYFSDKEKDTDFLKIRNRFITKDIFEKLRKGVYDRRPND